MQAGMYVYKGMSTKLQSDGEELFSCDPDHLFQFLIDLQERAQVTGGLIKGEF